MPKTKQPSAKAVGKDDNTKVDRNSMLRLIASAHKEVDRLAAA